MKHVRICGIILLMLGIIFALFTHIAFGKLPIASIWNGTDVKLEVSNDNYLVFTIEINNNNNSQTFKISGIKISDNNTFYYHDNDIEVRGKFSTNNLVSGTFKTHITPSHTITKHWNASFTKNLDSVVNANISPETNQTKLPTIKEFNTFSGHSGYVYSVAFSSDGKYALSGSADQTLKLWEVATGRELRSFNGHSDYVESVIFSPDGQYILSGSGDQTVNIWDANLGKLLKTLEGHTNTVTAVAFSPNGKYIVSGSMDNTIKIWESLTGKLIAILKGHSGWVNSVTFSPDSRYVLSGSCDQTLKLWDLTSLK